MVKLSRESDFTAEDFCLKYIVYIENILKTQCVPIIVGGSNSSIEKLMEDPVFMFKYKYDSCLIWIDVEQSVLNRRVDTKVDKMVNAGLVDVVRQIFIPDAHYTKGIQRSIGVPEMAGYLREEKNIDGDDETKKIIQQASISSIKRNTSLVVEVPQIFIPDADYTNEIGRSIGVLEMAKYLREEKNIDGDDESKKMILQASISSIKAKMNTFIINNNKFNKKKVMFIMGATGMGKSRLSVDLATHFLGEIINSDKMQVYKGLEIVTNKITHAEKQGVRHYLLEQSILNLRVDMRVDEMVNAEQSVLNRRVDTRVDEMVNAGLVNEMRQIFRPDADNTKGIRRSICVPEMAKYLREKI
ncbi:hypothetical protein H5410_001352 [Solanum commersonii]|uniref:Uncharacterized protein n=1 Tax=Solanum commersonii TaxID=4109 RepID=A0A9J6AZE7_SOLCO|nr:hypothetical protein H5410_001352 [Solanum commersonii]